MIVDVYTYACRWSVCVCISLYVYLCVSLYVYYAQEENTIQCNEHEAPVNSCIEGIVYYSVHSVF